MTVINGAITVQNGASSTVAGRNVFYNNSAFDSVSNDGAIATDKTALLPGGVATFANYTSYSKGLNGVIVDISGPVGSLSPSDFAFKVGNSNTPSSWNTLATTPTITVRPGAGVGGSNRVEIVFPDGAIAGQWLQVTVLGNGNTGLASNDVFYFGNAVGDAGNSTTDAKVTSFDELLARVNPTASAAVNNTYDYNRDGKVDINDQSVAAQNATCFINALNLINLGTLGPTIPIGPSLAPPPATVPTGPNVTPPSPTTTGSTSAAGTTTTTCTVVVAAPTALQSVKPTAMPKLASRLVKTVFSQVFSKLRVNLFDRR